MEFNNIQLKVAYLEARVAGLETALRRRSEQLKQIQQHLDVPDLHQLSRLVHGLPLLPRHAYNLEMWAETNVLTHADVEDTLLDLWTSLEHTAKQGGLP